MPGTTNFLFVADLQNLRNIGVKSLQSSLKLRVEFFVEYCINQLWYYFENPIRQQERTQTNSQNTEDKEIFQVMFSTLTSVRNHHWILFTY